MRRLLALFPLLIAFTAGCPGGGSPTANPTAAVGAVVDTSKLTISKPVDGVVTVSAAAGAVSGAPATTVTLTIMRESPSPAPAGYRLQHLSGGLPVAAGFATLNAEGGFSEMKMGDAERPVQTGDELNLTPQRGVAQAGFTFATPVP